MTSLVRNIRLRLLMRPTTINSYRDYRSTRYCSTMYHENSNYPLSYYYNKNPRHLGSGTECPPLQNGKLRIYSMRFCPFAQRAILVAIAKGIEHDVVNCDLKDKANWLLERNPLGKVPVIETNSGDQLYESLVVSEYLNEAYGSNSLFPTNPMKKARDKLWIAKFEKTIASFYRTVFSLRDEDESKAETFIEKLNDDLKLLNDELNKRKTNFFGGPDKPGMLDYMIWPWFERLPTFFTLLPKTLKQLSETNLSNQKTLTQWIANMEKDEAVKAFHVPANIHLSFMKSFIEGSPNYSLLEISKK